MNLPLFLKSRVKLSSYHGDDWKEYLFLYGRTRLYQDIYLVRTPVTTRSVSAREVLVLEGEVMCNGRRARVGDWFEVEAPTELDVIKESVYLERV